MDCEPCFETYAKDEAFKVHWIVMLSSDDQAYSGRAYVRLKRHCGDLADLTGSEWNGLRSVIRRYENVRTAFGADLFRACLMNNAFQHENPSPHVHFRVRPRYGSVVGFAGERFYGSEFGHHYSGDRTYASGDTVVRTMLKLKRNDKG